jgi:prevent-host-death family protein
MTEVGIRELRNHLSRYLDRVKGGEEVTVTDRGRAVARLTPITESRPFDRLVAEGRITPAINPDRALPETLIPTSGSVSELVDELRR